MEQKSIENQWNRLAANSNPVRRCRRESCRDGIELYCDGTEGLKSAHRTQKGERR